MRVALGTEKAHGDIRILMRRHVVMARGLIVVHDGVVALDL
jgi:hypothetical protein